MHELVAKARDYATRAHARIDQQRKYSNQPYDVHLKRVAELVAEVTDDAEMLAAAWLHDTVEDTPATLSDIRREFGPGIEQLVAELTDVSRPSDGNRALRKRLDREHLARASNRAKTVKLADLIDNCRDICAHDERFARVFVAEMKELLAVLDTGDEILLRRAHKTMARCLAQIGDAPQEDAVRVPRDMGSADDPATLDNVPNIDRSRISRLFTDFFAARDIAEPLASFDSAIPVDEVVAVMDEKGWFVAGLREAGEVVAYFMREDIDDGAEGNRLCGDYRREFRRTQRLAADAPLAEVIFTLTRHSACFVEQFGAVSGIIIRDFVDKPEVRMWLFGILTIIETHFGRRIRDGFPDEVWTRYLSAARLEKARAMQAERERRGQQAPLLDCLQFSDKAEILVKDDAQLKWLGFPTRRVAKSVIKDLESLRNNLAHSQSIVAHDWVQIARMTQRLSALVRRSRSDD